MSSELDKTLQRAGELFPPGCTCSSYGHGLTMTRVTAQDCPIHGEQEFTFEEYARLDGSAEPCRCVYPDKCFCKPEAKAARLDGSSE